MFRECLLFSRPYGNSVMNHHESCQNGNACCQLSLTTPRRGKRIKLKTGWLFCRKKLLQCLSLETILLPIQQHKQWMVSFIYQHGHCTPLQSQHYARIRRHRGRWGEKASLATAPLHCDIWIRVSAPARPDSSCRSPPPSHTPLTSKLFLPTPAQGTGSAQPGMHGPSLSIAPTRPAARVT